MTTSLHTSENAGHTVQAPCPLPASSNEYERRANLKRSRSESEGGDFCSEPFQIRIPGSCHGAFVTARPLLLLPRTSLPLCYLDFGDHFEKEDRLPRNFAANIQSLEGLDSKSGFNNKASQVLVITLGTLSHLYVVERIQKYIYTICRLGAWVAVQELRRLAKTSLKDDRCSPIRNESCADDWWTTTAVNGSLTDRRLKKARIAYEPTSTQDIRSLEKANSPEQLRSEEGLRGAGHEAEEPIASFSADQPSSAEDTYHNVVDKYLDMLYMSKASLAYFAKGPLARARATFKTAEDCLRHPYELAEFLRGMIYNSSTMDKKYKTSLPATIISILTTETPPKPKKRKKSQSFKPGKDGLLPSETEAAQRWWNGEETQQLAGFLGENPEPLIKTKLSSLRFRENLLQLILLLEVQAIESTSDGKRPSLESTEQERRENDEEPKKASKLRKPLDLKDVMDALVDRLTIWQSVSSSELGNNDSQISEGAKHENASANPPTSTPNDGLKDFHAQVIVPFFAARLPRIVDELGRKFGVPTRKSPNKSSSSSSKRKSHKVQPGGEAKRLPNEKTHRGLQKAQGISNSEKSMEPPLLTRSSTDPTLLSIKRERSSTPSAISGHYDSKRALSRSNSISQARRLSQREVDLSAITKFNESKSKKKAAVAMELKEAIAALKKPNRDLAVKEYFETAESVRPPLQDCSNKPKTANQKRNVKLIEVTATPRRVNKLKSCATIPQPNHYDISDVEDHTPSSISLIPSSTVRPSITDGTQDRHNMHLDPTGHLNIAETPSRGPKRHQRITMEVGSSPSHATDLLVVPAPQMKPKFPTTTVFSPLPGEKKKRLSPAQFQSIFSTPVKGQSDMSPQTLGKISFTRAAGNVETKDLQEGTVFNTEPCESAPANSCTPKRSIYETLGWDDDDVDELM